MNDLAWLDALDSFLERGEQRAVVFHSVPRHMDNVDPEIELTQVVFVLEAAIDS